MNLKITYIASIFFIASLPFNSSAAWFFTEDILSKGGEITDGAKKLTDEEYVFRFNGLLCVAQETEFTRAPDDSIVEYRDLSCLVADDTYVSITVNCNLPRYELAVLNIEKSGKKLNPALICGPDS